MPARPLKVIVIGAGTGGMCLAHGLRHAGIDVEVFERDRTRTGGLHGYRVGISPNGARALKACLSPALFDTFVATTAAPYDNVTMYTERFKVLMGIPAGDMAGGENPEDRDHNVSRMTLRQVLFTGMEDVIRFDRRCTGYTQHDDGRVTAHFDDGSGGVEDVTGDLLVGADGANSPVRRQYLPHAGHTETGLVAIGGKVALTGTNRDLLPERAMHGLSMLFDRRGQFGITHAMYMPWVQDGAPGSTDRALVDAWPGLRYDNTTDQLSWGLSTSRTLAPADALARRGADLNALALDLTRDWDPRWRELVATSDPAASIVLSVRTSDPLTPWEPSPVTLIGDAAHTMTPGRGAGANTALRDARELRDRLVRVRDGELSLVAAVGEYEDLMRRYSALAVRESLENMNDDGTARRPIVGPLSVLAQRTGMRLVDHLPPVKRRIARGMQKVRDSELV